PARRRIALEAALRALRCTRSSALSYPAIHRHAHSTFAVAGKCRTFKEERRPVEVMRVEPAPSQLVTAEREHAHTERMVLALQVSVAFSFVAGSFLGLWHVDPLTRLIAAGWLIGYHLVLVAYSIRFRMRGRTILWAEPVIAVLNLSC